MVASAGWRRWDSAAEGGRQSRNFGPAIAGSFSVRRSLAALGGLFTRWHFIVVIAASEDVPRTTRQELPGKNSPAMGKEHLRRHIPGPLHNYNVSGVDGPRCASVSAQTVLGGVLGGNLAFYTMITPKHRFVSGCAINKKEEEVVLHTQEAWGSSPYAPTIRINEIRTLKMTSYAPGRRSDNPRQSFLRLTGRALPESGLLSAQIRPRSHSVIQAATKGGASERREMHAGNLLMLIAGLPEFTCLEFGSPRGTLLRTDF